MTNRHMTAGVMSIISGALGVVGGLGMAALLVVMFGAIAQDPSVRRGAEMPTEIFRFIQVIYAGLGIAFALVGVLAIIGGVFALKRKRWGLALAGAIAGSIAFYPAGIVGVIFVCLAKSEFQTPALAAAEVTQPSTQIPGQASGLPAPEASRDQ